MRSLFHRNVRQDGVLLCNGGQFFEELGEEDGGEDFGLIHRDGFGFVGRSLQHPALLCEEQQSQLHPAGREESGENPLVCPAASKTFLPVVPLRVTGGLDLTRLSLQLRLKVAAFRNQVEFIPIPRLRLHSAAPASISDPV